MSDLTKQTVWLTKVDDREYWTTTRRNPNSVKYVLADALKQAQERYRKLAASLSYEKEGRTISPAAYIEQAQARIDELEGRVAIDERIAQLRAHRSCGNEEHDPTQGKTSGFCVVCLTPWPCKIAALGDRQ